MNRKASVSPSRTTNALWAMALVFMGVAIGTGGKWFWSAVAAAAVALLVVIVFPYLPVTRWDRNRMK